MKKDSQEIAITKKRFADKLKGINYSFVSAQERVENLLKIITRIRIEEIVEKIKAEEYLWRESGTDLNKHFFVMKQIYMKIFRLRNFIYYNDKRLLNVAGIHELLAHKAQNNIRL